MLKGLLLSLLLPPTCFIYAGIIGLIARRRKAGRIFAAAGLAGLFISAMPIVPGLAILALEQNLPRTPPAAAPPQAIVILSGDLNRTAEPPYALPGRLTNERLRAGAELWRRTKLPVLVTGGVIHEDRPPIARVMADSLRDDFRVPVEWVEDTSATTWENAALSAAILKRQGITSVYVVTHGWHLPRAIAAFRAAGLIATAAPTSLSDPTPWRTAMFIPSADALEATYFAAHEWIGRAWYAIR